ncbi:MAG TPA: dihydrofolate reductase family protein [Solirubrobacteraceae bacterium]
MAQLIYSAIASLDGFTADESGQFDWAAPDEEVHAFVNELERPVGTYLLGRRMYDTMVVWETMDVTGRSPASRDFAEIWRGADKIVYSKTLEEPRSASTRVERDFDVEAIRQMKATSVHDLSIGGAELASQAMVAGLVDELQLFLNPVIVGGGTPALPRNARFVLELLAERSFASGVTYLRYRVRG